MVRENQRLAIADISNQRSKVQGIGALQLTITQRTPFQSCDIRLKFLLRCDSPRFEPLVLKCQKGLKKTNKGNQRKTKGNGPFLSPPDGHVEEYYWPQ